MKLQIANKDQSIQSGIVPIRWCISKKLLEALKKAGRTDPHVLIIVAANGYEVSRQLAPLEQLMDYIEFRNPGKNTIMAAIVCGKKSALSNRYLLEKDNLFLYDESSDRYEFSGNAKYNFFGRSISRLDVIIPDGIFAKEPPNWEKKWINLWFREKAKNQCQYRRRRILAYTIQPPAVFIYMILILGLRSIIALSYLLCGVTDINFKPLIHPWKNDTDNMAYDIETLGDILKKSIFTIKSTKDGQKTMTWPFTITAAPIFTLPAFLIFSYLQGVTKGIIMATAVALAPSLLIMILVGFMIVMTATPGERPNDNNKEKKSIARKYKYDTQDLICSTASSNADISPKTRIVYLKFMALKARVCRPFSY